MSKKNQNPGDGVIRIVGEGLSVALGGPGEPAFAYSELRHNLDKAIDYLVKGGQVALAGKVYDIKRVNINITAMLAVEAPVETWGILMARQQGVESEVHNVLRPDGRVISISVPKQEVSRETGEPSGEENGTAEKGPGQEEEAISDMDSEADPSSSL